MKRILLVALVVLSAAACKKITPETRIAQIDQHFNGKEAVYSAKLPQYADEKLLDYLTLQLAGELGAKDIWTLEEDGQVALVAEYPGKEKKNTQITMISAPLSDPNACATLLEMLEAYKKIKIQHNNNIRAIFYSPASDSTGINGLTLVNQDIRESGDMVLFDIEVATRDDQPLHTFVLDESPFFAKTIIDVVPGYLAPLGEYQVVQGVFPNLDWQLRCPIYRYHVDPSAFQQETAAVTAFTFLLN